MKVEHMNASPRLDFDVMRTTDLVGGPFTPPGFYYKTFIRPRRFWPLYEKFLRHAAGLGKLRKTQPEREWRTEYRRRHADVLVIGGGAAGLSAAAAAADLGADVVLADEGPEPGGRLLAEGGVEYARELAERARAAGVEILSNAPALGTFDGLVPVWQGDTLHQVRARRQIHATGAIEQPLVFPGNDLPGVMLSGGARRLISMYALQPGTRAVVATVDDRGLDAALALLDAGVEVCCVADLRQRTSGGPTAALQRKNVELLRAATDRSLAERPEAWPSNVAVPPPVTSDRSGKCFACLCEDVTAKDIHLSVEEGYDSIELSKRYTTTTMGPCQGRMCQLPAVRLMARETGTSLADVGTTTARPPWHAVPMGALAGRPFEPAKRSSIHARHRQLGGNIMWAGDWRRAYDYGDPKAEAMAVHRTAGLIDVSTLGKVIVRGPDAGEFLDRLYPNRFSNLKPGRIRYGVITSDSGRVMDDGTVCRLDDESFYVTTTSSGAGAVYDWFSWWLADWQLDVHLTDVTQGLSAVNLAGPRAREIMGGVTELDCSAEAFTYLDGKQALVAGVPCLILRIGFVGEVGYEIHCPAAQGEHLWDALMEAGKPHGVRAFGLEPQRLLRLQKMHILVGQDTDSESNPFGAAMSWIVKLDKEQDFIGRWALEHYAGEDLEASLVGFTLANGHVPTEGAVVLADGDGPMGQVTSARYSKQLGKVIGMAWVPAPLAKDGAGVTISDNGRRLP